MSLTTKLADQFSNSARHEGSQLQKTGNVKITDFGPGWLEVTVQGTTPYEVMLERQKGTIRYSCDCPYFTSTLETCKHVWAALVQAEAQGFVDEWQTSRQLELVPAEEDEDDYADLPGPAALARGLQAIRPTVRRPSSRQGRKGRATVWKQSLGSLRDSMNAAATEQRRVVWPPGKEVIYVVDVARTLEGQGTVIEINARERKKNGDWAKPKKQVIRADEITQLPDVRDREILSMLSGAKSTRDSYSSYYYSSYDYNASSSFRLGEAMLEPVVKRMCQTGRCRLRVGPEQELSELTWDEAGPWEFWLVTRQDAEAKQFILDGELRRGEARMELPEPVLLVAGGLVFTQTTVAPLDDRGAFPWIVMLRENKQLTIPIEEKDELIQQMLAVPRLPRVDVPDELKFEEVHVKPQPRLRVHKPKKNYYYDNRLRGELSFDYEGAIVSFDETGRGIYQPDKRRLILRDEAAEADAAGKLRAVGFRLQSGYYGEPPGYELNPTNLPAAIRRLTAEGWHVEADGHLYRQPGEIKIDVTSGIDWFELHGTADFGGQSVKLPELLAALRRGEKTVRLDDGTFGVLPEQWLQKYGLLADMGTATEDHIRFGRSQVGVLDALLMSQPQATCDEVFDQARRQMREFAGVKPADAPQGFTGILRPYQREGLGWMQFLRDFHFGGCLADDMGLGKTVQVLALLEGRRELRASSNGNREKPAGPSLVVVPRSLIFNWREEATRFAPQLKVLDHTGIGRAKNADAFPQYDLIMTTYGTLRNDAIFFKDVRFDYVILDEAQAIKNASSESAKACRLLQGDHRLALSGTPVQNHLGELWSLFEFLNPGMLGTARAFQATGATARVVDETTRQLLSRALKPFILRRTKGQVAKDLPQRVEQTIHCELDASQRKLYDELKEHYRQSLLSRIATEGIKKAKIQILEALLRLRQAACHPGLIDKSKTSIGSAKLDSLLAQINEVMDEGHKVLVFSQFTSFLAIVRDRLDKEKVRYEYLDGRTRDRQSVVDRFQTDPDTKLFLISLKAGGLGLNLTAAEYVFLLDPWWNPAVEAQAIDRAHRIGQTRQVFAYRLIAKDTVEEKVLQLQQTKRDLADAIISADNSLISRLGREDLELLLS